jgi:hypothetical protein
MHIDMWNYMYILYMYVYIYCAYTHHFWKRKQGRRSEGTHGARLKCVCVRTGALYHIILYLYNYLGICSYAMTWKMSLDPLLNSNTKEANRLCMCYVHGSLSPAAQTCSLQMGLMGFFGLGTAGHGAGQFSVGAELCTGGCTHPLRARHTSCPRYGK